MSSSPLFAAAARAAPLPPPASREGGGNAQTGGRVGDESSTTAAAVAVLASGAVERREGSNRTNSRSAAEEVGGGEVANAGGSGEGVATPTAMASNKGERGSGGGSGGGSGQPRSGRYLLRALTATNSAALATAAANGGRGGVFDGHVLFPTPASVGISGLVILPTTHVISVAAAPASDIDGSASASSATNPAATPAPSASPLMSAPAFDEETAAVPASTSSTVGALFVELAPSAPPVASISMVPLVASISTVPPVASDSTVPPVASGSTVPPVAAIPTPTAPPVAFIPTHQLLDDDSDYAMGVVYGRDGAAALGVSFSSAVTAAPAASSTTTRNVTVNTADAEKLLRRSQSRVGRSGASGGSRGKAPSGARLSSSSGGSSGRDADRRALSSSGSGTGSGSASPYSAALRASPRDTAATLLRAVDNSRGEVRLSVGRGVLHAGTGAALLRRVAASGGAAAVTAAAALAAPPRVFDSSRVSVGSAASLTELLWEGAARPAVVVAGEQGPVGTATAAAFFDDGYLLAPLLAAPPAARAEAAGGFEAVNYAREEEAASLIHTTHVLVPAHTLQAVVLIPSLPPPSTFVDAAADANASTALESMLDGSASLVPPRRADATAEEGEEGELGGTAAAHHSVAATTTTATSTATIPPAADFVHAAAPTPSRVLANASAVYARVMSRVGGGMRGGGGGASDSASVSRGAEGPSFLHQHQQHQHPHHQLGGGGPTVLTARAGYGSPSAAAAALARVNAVMQRMSGAPGSTATSAATSSSGTHPSVARTPPQLRSPPPLAAAAVLSAPFSAAHASPSLSTLGGRHGGVTRGAPATASASTLTPRVVFTPTASLRSGPASSFSPAAIARGSVAASSSARSGPGHAEALPATERKQQWARQQQRQQAAAAEEEEERQLGIKRGEGMGWEERRGAEWQGRQDRRLQHSEGEASHSSLSFVEQGGAEHTWQGPMLPTPAAHNGGVGDGSEQRGGEGGGRGAAASSPAPPIRITNENVAAAIRGLLAGGGGPTHGGEDSGSV